VSQANPDAEPWRAALAAAGATVQIEQAGSWVDLGDGVALWVFWPPPGGFVGDNVDNENSLVMKLVYGEFSVLLMGDAGIPTESALVQQSATPNSSLLASTVLKVGHHGSKGSSSDQFLQAVQAKVTVIQVGVDNDYGHPHQDVLARLAGQPVLRNDQHGRIHIYSDGQQMWLETERALPAFLQP
jgi:competence protein ComEC